MHQETAASGTIRAYPGRASVLPGERLVLHVATGSRRFRVHFYRWRDGFEAMHSSSWQAGERARERGPGQDWGWPAYEFPIPAHWPSAVYIAHLEDAEGKTPLSLGLDAAAALFVVRGQRRGGMLYKLPLATWHAYNLSGGGCYYANPAPSLDPPGARVSLQRPGGGIGGPSLGRARPLRRRLDAPDLRPLGCALHPLAGAPGLCARVLHRPRPARRSRTAAALPPAGRGRP